MKLKYFTFFLSVFCALLIYKVVDISVTLDFANKEVIDLQSDIKMLKRYQGKKCSEAVEKIDGVSIFKKDDHLVIEGVSFVCEPRDQILWASDQ